jgi:small conductance mechanosensitive channel
MNWNEPFEGVVHKLLGWGRELILLLPNFAAALFVFLAFWLVARVVRRTSTRLLGRTHAPRQIQRLLVSVAGMLVLAAGLFISLGILQLDKALASLLAGAGILGLALSFAVQDITANFISGIFLAIRRPFRLGEEIETNDLVGKVERIDLRATVLRSSTGQLVIIPNKMIFEHSIVNFTATGERRVDLKVGVSYDDDLERVESVTRSVIETLPQRNPERPFDLLFTDFGDSAIQLLVRFWISQTRQVDDQVARSEAIKAIHKAYKEADISIPYPVQTLDLSLAQAGLGALARQLAARARTGDEGDEEGAEEETSRADGDEAAEREADRPTANDPSGSTRPNRSSRSNRSN